MSPKMTNNLFSLSPMKRQSGAALVTGLIFLVVLTMIGVTAARMSTLEERMSGNMRDRSIAMQAAELALRDAERDVSNSVAASNRNISGITSFVADCGASSSTIEDDGLCYNGSTGYATAIWTTANWTTTSSTTVPASVPLGLFTTRTSPTGTTPDSNKAIPVVSAQPRYIIEGIRKTPPGVGDVFYYRITVRAQGVNPNTVVWLQEVFRP